MSIELELTKDGRVKLTSRFARECIDDLRHEALMGLSCTAIQERGHGKYFINFCDIVDKHKLLSTEDAAAIRELANKIGVMIDQFCDLGDKAHCEYMKHSESILYDRNKLEAYIKDRFNAIPKLSK